MSAELNEMAEKNMDLNELADRAGRLGGRDPALSKDIYRALFEVPELSPVEHGYGWREDDSGWWCQTGEDQRVPRQRIDPPDWLGSIDAAMTLVPEGFNVQFERTGNTSRACVWHGARIVSRYGASPALALTAAALHARSQAASQ
jgi:hypothetical protein